MSNSPRELHNMDTRRSRAVMLNSVEHGDALPPKVALWLTPRSSRSTPSTLLLPDASPFFGLRRLPKYAGMMSLCQVGKSGESHVRRSLRRRDRGLYRQSDQLLNGCDGL